MSNPQTFRLFGRPALIDGGNEEVRVGTRKHIALLACLILDARDRPVARDTLINLLWSDVSDERGRHSLAQAIMVLRRALGAESLSRGRADVRLLTDVVTELDNLDRLMASADARPLDGMDGWAGAALAHWTDGARVRITERAVDSLRDAIERARRDGDVERVYRLALRLHSLDPLADVAVRALAERRLVEGDSVGALRLLRVHASQVREELDCEPHRDVMRLLRRLEQGAGAYLATVPSRLAATIERVRPTVFLGRERELARLEAEWAHVCEGNDRALLVRGTGGIGKSAILRRFATGVGARAHPVHVVSCQEIAAAIPYAAVSDLIASLARDPAVSGTDPMWLGEATRIYPALRARYPGIPEPPTVPPEVVCVRIAESLRHMIEAVAEDGPVLVGFDDVQHLDATSRAVLSMVQRRLTGRPVMVLGALRSDRIDGMDVLEHPDAALNWDDTLQLSPLDDDTTRTLTICLSEDLTARTDVCDEIVALAQGNPYFAEMLVADWTRHHAGSLAGARARGDGAGADWQPPSTLRSAFARLYDGLPTPSRNMLHLLAVARRGLVPEALARTLGLDTARLDEAVLEAIERRLIRLDGRLLCFKHELHREYVYWSMSADARRFHHGKLARALSELAGETAFGELLEAGRHFLDAGRVDEAREATVEGARRAIDGGAPQEAERVLQLLRRRAPHEAQAEVALLLAEAAADQGKAQTTLVELRESGTLVLTAAQRATKAVLEAEARHRIRRSSDSELHALARVGVSRAEQVGGDRLLPRAIQTLAEVSSEIGLSDDLKHAKSIAIRLADDRQPTVTRARAFMTNAYCEMMSGAVERAASVFEESADLCRQTGIYTGTMRALNGLGICTLGLGRVRHAVSAFVEALGIADQLGDAVHRATLWGNLGVAYEAVGQLSDATRCYEMGVRISRQSGSTRRKVESLMNAADLAILFGRLDEAAAILAEADLAASQSRLWRLQARVLLAMADLDLARGTPEGAWGRIESATELGRFGQRPTDGMGRFFRLRDLMILETDPSRHGQPDTLAQRAVPTALLPQTIDQLEYGIFRGWAANHYGTSWDDADHVLRAEERGLVGIVGRLVALGICARPELEPRASETSAQVLERVYPLAGRRQRLPTLAQLIPDAESQRSA